MDAKALKKAFTAPKSITDFFKPRGGVGAAGAAGAATNGSTAAAGAASTSVGSGDAGATVGNKRSGGEAAVPPAVKRQAAKGGGTGAMGAIAAVLSRGLPQQQRGQQGAPGPAPVVDLAAEDDSCGAGSLRGAGGATSDVLRASSRLNGSSGEAGSEGGAQRAGGLGAGAAKRPGSGGRLDPAALEALTAMGFTGQQAERALRVTSGDVERAANWILMGS